jgi:CheY-like chemotaxis protein
MLEGLGYKVIAAGNGTEAVELFKANANQIDLVVLDVMMPFLSGPDAFVQISEIRPGTRALFTSGYSAETPSLKSAIGEGTPVLQKPYGIKSLSQAVRNALHTNGSKNLPPV